MKIIILGAGQVGGTLAENLVGENNEITVIDSDPTILRALQDRLDLQVVTGVGSHPDVLRKAGAEDADMLIAVVFINPEIIRKDGSTISEEGCLSVPGNYAKVERAEAITVKALDQNGESFELDAEGLLAICIQHELDHLKGKLFIDYLSPLKRQRIRKKLEKEARLAAKA